jgi:16S rRNA (uracil1498-N3)-methyltransferase
MLPEDEAHHALRVVRIKVGDEIAVVDGEGGWHRVRLDHVDRRSVSGRVVESRREVGEPDYELTIGLGLLKNRTRFETFLEKAVELGVGTIAPLLTERTERERIKESRARNILIAAMKQSQRSRLVRLDEARALGTVVQSGGFDQILICHEQESTESGILDALKARSTRRVLVLVGPEGGFSDDEVQAVMRMGGVRVSLGPRRLRAETAALAAAAAVMMSRV